MLARPLTHVGEQERAYGNGSPELPFVPGLLSRQPGIPAREAIPLSQAAARKAIELDDQGAEGHASLGTTHFAYDWDMRASEEEFKRAIELNPNYAFARHIHSILLSALGKQDEAIAEIRKAADVDPL